MLLIFLFKIIPFEYSLLNFHLLSKNPIFYRIYISRENEFKVLKPVYFYLREFLFFKETYKRITPYYIRFDWGIGFYKSFSNSDFKFFYSHVCNHGIDHRGEDRRQWNQIGFKMVLRKENFYFSNSIGYVTSPFGPKRFYNNYYWILFSDLIFKKDLRLFSLLFDINLTGFYTLKSLKYEWEFKIYLLKNDFSFGFKNESKYGLLGNNKENFIFNSIFIGLFKNLTDLNFLYGYLYKNLKYGFFSKGSVKYKIFKNIKILTDIETISFLHTQRPRFDDFKMGGEFKFKNLKLILYHRERRDDNLFDGKVEKLKTLEINFSNFILGYSFYRKNYPFLFFTGIKYEKYIYSKSIFFVKYNFYFLFLQGKKENGFIIESGPSFLIIKDREVALSYTIKAKSENVVENYGLFENRIFISFNFDEEIINVKN